MPIGIFIGLIFLIEVLFLIDSNLTTPNISLLESYNNDLTNALLNNYFVTTNNYFEIVSLTNIEQIGNVLYNKYVYLFLLGGMVLLIAMLGAIILTLNQKLKNKKQEYYTQTNRELFAAIRFLK